MSWTSLKIFAPTFTWNINLIYTNSCICHYLYWMYYHLHANIPSRFIKGTKSAYEKGDILLNAALMAMVSASHWNCASLVQKTNKQTATTTKKTKQNQREQGLSYLDILSNSEILRAAERAYLCSYYVTLFWETGNCYERQQNYGKVSPSWSLFYRSL